MKSKTNFLLLLFVFTILSNSIGLKAQQSSLKNSFEQSQAVNPNKGKKAIRQLHDGTLIVRLSVFPDKINHLEKVEGKGRAQFELDRITNANKGIIADFMKDYNFSDVVFTYGAELDEFLHEGREGIFLDENLNFDPSIKIKDGPILILATKSTTDFKLCDINFTPLQKPFIGYVSHHMDENYHVGVDAAAQEFREYVTRDRTVKNFNKRLHFHNKNFWSF